MRCRARSSIGSRDVDEPDGEPACANTCAMPLPIVPAPTTPTVLMFIDCIDVERRDASHEEHRPSLRLCGLCDDRHIRSTASATPLPPPRHSVAMPRFSVALLQRVEERRQDARAARADRVAERDSAAVHVDLRAGSMPSSFSTATACTENASFSSNRSTSSSVQPIFSRDSADGFDRRHQHELRRQAARRLADDARERRQAERAAPFRRHHDQRRGAVVDAGRVAGGDRAVLLERRLQRARAPRAVVSARIDSSRSTTTGAPFRCGIETGRISSANSPASVAAPPSGGCAAAYASCALARRRCTARRRPRRRSPCGTARRRTTGRRRSSSRPPRRCPAAALRARAAAGTGSCSSTPCRRRRRCRCRRRGSPERPA